MIDGYVGVGNNSMHNVKVWENRGNPLRVGTGKKRSRTPAIAKQSSLRSSNITTIKYIRITMFITKNRVDRV